MAITVPSSSRLANETSYLQQVKWDPVDSAYTTQTWTSDDIALLTHNPQLMQDNLREGNQLKQVSASAHRRPKYSRQIPKHWPD